VGVAGLPRRRGHGVWGRTLSWLVLALWGCASAPCPGGTSLRVTVGDNGRERACILPDGTHHGPYAEFDAKGTRIAAGIKRRGKAVGSWTWYYENGSVMRQGSYIDGVPDGLWVEFHPSGPIRQRGRYRSGVKVGYWEELGVDGDREVTSMWTDGEGTGQSTTFHGDGVRASFGALDQGRRVEVWEERWPDGSRASRGRFINGLEDGEFTTWHETGARASNGHYQRGVKIGEWTEWHDNGETAARGRLDAGQHRGLWQYWSRNGKQLPTAHDQAVQSGVGWIAAQRHPDPRVDWIHAGGQGAATGAAVTPKGIGYAVGRQIFELDWTGEVIRLATSVEPLAPQAPFVLGSELIFRTQKGNALIVGTDRWRLHELGARDLPWAFTGVTLVYADDTGLRGFDRADWWQLAVGGQIDHVGAGDGLAVAVTTTRKVVAADLHGKKLWSADAAGRAIAAPIVASGVVVVATDEGALRAFSAVDGHELWSRPVPGLAAGAVVTANKQAVAVLTSLGAREFLLADGGTRVLVDVLATVSAGYVDDELARIDEADQLHVGTMVVPLSGASGPVGTGEDRVAVSTDRGELVVLRISGREVEHGGTAWGDVLAPDLRGVSFRAGGEDLDVVPEWQWWRTREDGQVRELYALDVAGADVLHQDLFIHLDVAALPSGQERSWDVGWPPEGSKPVYSGQLHSNLLPVFTRVFSE